MKTVVGKVVVLGHQGVGKTSTIIRYVEKNYSPDISSTVGASFFTCNVFVDDLIVKLQIWDTAGQERFKAMVPMFYRNSNAALLVFDLTQEDTFESMKSWTQELKRNVEEPMILCVVGNKNDLCEKRQVDRETGHQYANSIGACYFECSAKEDQGVEQIFTSLSRSLAIMTGARKFNKISAAGDSESGNSALMAESSELDPTDVGRTETASWSISSIAHGNVVAKPKCC